MLSNIVFLFNSDFCAPDGFAGEGFDLALDVGDNAVFCGVDGVVAANIGAIAGALGQANLADNNFAITDFFTAKALNT